MSKIPNRGINSWVATIATLLGGLIAIGGAALTTHAQDSDRRQVKRPLTGDYIIGFHAMAQRYAELCKLPDRQRYEAYFREIQQILRGPLECADGTKRKPLEANFIEKLWLRSAGLVDFQSRQTGIGDFCIRPAASQNFKDYPDNEIAKGNSRLFAAFILDGIDRRFLEELNPAGIFAEFTQIMCDSSVE